MKEVFKGIRTRGQNMSPDMEIYEVFFYEK